VRRGTSAWVAALFVPTLTAAVAVPGRATSTTTSRSTPLRNVGAIDGVDAPRDHPVGHEGDEGLVLAPATSETVAGRGECLPGAAVREFDIVALAVDITLNRYGDHDPDGFMYALAGRVDEVRAAERQRAEAVSLGLQGDVIQPLVLRVLPGECMRVRLTNELEDQPASFHLHDSALVVRGGAGPAVAANPAALAAPNATVEYEWMIAADEPEGTHVFHSHGNPRFQSGHGLFGAVVVEPTGSSWSDPRTGEPETTAWDAVIQPSGGPSFREFVLLYHEIGDEDYRVLDAADKQLPQVDPTTSAYRPGSRAINYRSEPFYNRLTLGAEHAGHVDESLAYSSYSYGDPATPIERTYVGEPVKERVVHAGSEVFHVHHVHGGSVRWRRQPGAGPTGFGGGLDKHPDVLPGPSERTDSQTIGPSETFDVDHECSAGGCQQSAGDYLIHCHIAHHYFAGMWGIWRVYNTLQGGDSSTDTMAPLPLLPDRSGTASPAVTSDELDAAALGRAVDSLPPAGAPKSDDASVFDWITEGGRILGEPETTDEWPGYRSPEPGARRPILFDRATGQPAYPMLRPHLAARPPFAPGNGPAAHVDRPRADGRSPPPGADGPGSLCPEGTELRTLSMRAVELPVPINDRIGLTDTLGTLFVLAEDEAALEENPELRTPLAVRANAGEDCIDVVLTSAVPDNANHEFSKVSAHVHFMQFDPQVSDGVVTGFNFEQTIRPFAQEGEVLTADAAAGDGRVFVANADRFSPGAFVAVGIEDGVALEIRRIETINAGGEIVLDRALERPHPAGGIVSSEFVRYRWYPDVQVGTSYFHDHVNGIRTWQHGLIGAIVVEPPGATYHDPVTGAPVSSGAIADIRVPDDTPVSADVSGSFREFVCFIQDPSRLTGVDRSPGANINLRAEPLERRDLPVEGLFSSAIVGDPVTPLPKAYVGDPVVVRITVGGTNEIHTWHIDGHWFRDEPWSLMADAVTTTHVGISERKDVTIPAAGGPQQRPGDYMYSDGRALKLQEGAWGLLRVVPGPAGGELEALPGHDPPTRAPPPVCPADAPVRRYSIAAVEAKLPMRGAETGRAFVDAASADSVLAGAEPVTPLVLRATTGDCIEVTLANLLPPGSDPVSLHADGLAYDPADSGGIAAGLMPDQSVALGGERTFTFYAHPEYGDGAKLLRDGADIAHSPRLGLYGAIVVSPTGATFESDQGWSTVVHGADGRSWRDAVLFMHDEDDAIGTHRMPYTTKVRGAAGLNYADGDPGPVVEAYAGEMLELHVLAPWSEQLQVFSLEGHRWPLQRRMEGTTHVGSVAVGGLESITVVPDGGAGGDAQLPGTYWFGNHREPYAEAGMKGLLVVHDRCAPIASLQPLAADPAPCAATAGAVTTSEPTSSSVSPPSSASPASPDGSSGGVAWTFVAIGATVFAALGVAVVVRRRRLSRVTPRG
jgi:multicopper oxidase